MTLQSAIEAELPFLRAEALARMTSRCKIAHKSGSAISGGLKVPTWTTDYTDHPIRVGGTNSGPSGSRTIDVAGVPVEVPIRVVSLPVTTTDLSDGSVIEVTEGECAGLFLRVVEAEWKDQATARRVQVVGIEEPEGWS